jgi:hypothetical protein
MGDETTIAESGTIAGHDLLGDAGRIVEKHSMVRIRRPETPIEEADLI